MKGSYISSENLTLAVAAKVFGYTPDHLAYLARGGFINAKRSGRIWLTTAEAIENYQNALNLAGRPVLASEHEAWSAHDSSESSESAEYISELSDDSKKGDFIEGLKILGKRYDSIFQSKVTPHYHSEPNTSVLGFAVGLAPNSLPTAPVPYYMTVKPWYRQNLVLIPVLAFALLMALINPNLPFKNSAVSSFHALERGLGYFAKSASSSIYENVKAESTKLSFDINDEKSSVNKAPETAGLVTYVSEFGQMSRKFGFLPVEGTDFIEQSMPFSLSKNYPEKQEDDTHLNQTIISGNELIKLLLEDKVVLQKSELGEIILKIRMLEEVNEP